MRGTILVLTLAGGILLGGAWAGAATVTPLPGKLFEMGFTDASGRPQEMLAPNGEIYLQLKFALLMSETSEYPVTVTLTMGKDVMELFNGRLSEGAYVLTEKIQGKSAWGPAVPYKATLKVKVVNRSTSGTDSYYKYFTAEGTLPVGYR
jgi:hypothetical protein